MMMRRQLARLLTLRRLSAARLRCHGYRALGLRGGEKGLFEGGVRIDRPWLASVGPRVVLQKHVWLALLSEEASLTLGPHVFVGRYTEIEVVQRVEIGDGVMIGPMTYITDHNHDIRYGSDPIHERPTIPAPVSIGRDAWIGAGCIILPGVTIGEGAIVAAGAVVHGDVAPFALVGGVPARFIRNRCAGDVHLHSSASEPVACRKG